MTFLLLLEQVSIAWQGTAREKEGRAAKEGEEKSLISCRLITRKVCLE